MRSARQVMLMVVAILACSLAQAEKLAVPAGFAVDCIPSPSIESIKSGSIFQGENPALVQMITCDVIEGQSIPAQSRLFGEVRAQSALGPYEVIWQRLQVQNYQGDLVWNPRHEDLVSSRIQSNGTLRVTFERTLSVDQATAPN